MNRLSCDECRALVEEWQLAKAERLDSMGVELREAIQRLFSSDSPEVWEEALSSLPRFRPFEHVAETRVSKVVFKIFMHMARTGSVELATVARGLGN